MSDSTAKLTTLLHDSYLEGAHQGAITTCALIYSLLEGTGLEKSNSFYALLEDIARTHGCTDLGAAAARLKAEDKSLKNKEQNNEK